MSVTVRWTVPTADLDSSKTYKVNVYATNAGEDGDYTKIDTIAAKSGTSYVATYTYAAGDSGYYFYVKYYEDPSGAEGDRVLAFIDFTVREQRLIEEFESYLPSQLGTFTDNDKRNSLKGAVHAINIISPLTEYTLSNMPKYWEPSVKLGAAIFAYLQKYLTVAIKDFTYGDNGLSLNVDRGSKMNTAIRSILDTYNEHIKWIKMNDYPDPIGLGSYAIAVPQGRVMGMLYNIREAQ